MSLSILASVLIIFIPSYVFAVTFRMMKVPLKVSLKDYKTPIQIVLLGVILPAIPYFLAYAVSSLFATISFYTPWKVLIGVVDFKSIPWADKWLFWSILFLIFCFIEALLLSLLARSKNGLIFLDWLHILDEQEYLAQSANSLSIEIDITVDGLPFVYSGTIEKIRTSSLLNRDCLQLSKVLKIPIEIANKDLGNYMVDIISKPETDSRAWLKTMIFPKDKINTLNLRVQKTKEFEIQLL